MGLRFIALCLIFLFAWLPAKAQDHGAVSYALTMHGAPALGLGFDHYPYTNPKAPKGGILRQAAIGTFDTLNPFTLKGKAAEGLPLIYDRLMDRSWDEPFTLYPLIARGVSVNTDRSVLTVYLDPHARFHNGSPITADDVLFSFQTLKEKGRPNMRRVYKLVDQADQIDTQTVRFTLGMARDRETVMILATMPVLSRAYWEKRDFNTAILDPQINASGPYRILAVDPGRRITYTRIKDYWAADLPVRKGLYNFDTITYDYFRDDTVAFESFKTGALNFRRELNVMKWTRAYDRTKDSKFRQDAIPHHRAEDVRGFIFNTRRAPFNDTRVRQALSMVFDFDWVNQNLYGGLLRRTASFFPGSDLADRPLAPPQKDQRAALKQADALLHQAGYGVKDGTRVSTKTGEPLVIDMILSVPSEEKIALSYARTLKKLGVTLRVRTLDIAAFRDRLNQFDYDMMAYYWLSTLSPGGEQLNNWGCAARDQQGGFNYAGICDPDLDRLAARIPQTTTRSDLQSATKAMDRALINGYYVIPWGYKPVDLIATYPPLTWPSKIPLWGFVPETMWASPVN